MFGLPRAAGLMAALMRAACLLGALAAAAHAGRAAAFTVSANLGGLEFDGTDPFVDLLHQARPWASPAQPWQGAPDGGVDEATGWPRGDFGVTSDATVVADEPYALRAECGARPAVTVMDGAVVNETWTPSASSGGVYTGNAVLKAPASSVMLSFRNTGGGCVNVSLMRPGPYSWPADALTFNPSFLKLLQPLSGQSPPAHLRFMNWLSTNGNAGSTWSQRPRPGWGASFTYGPPAAPTGGPGVANCTQTPPCYTDETDSNHPLFPGRALTKGVPWEVVVALANELHIAPWVNIPWAACVTDSGCADYATSLMQLLKSSLDADLPIYVEYSNEVWNPSFGQGRGQWAYANHSVRVEGDPLRLHCTDDGSNEYQWAPRLTAHKLRVIATAAQSVFGAASDRVRPVLAGQVMGEPQLQGLRWLTTCGSVQEPSSVFWATANAPYFTLYPDNSASRSSRSCLPSLTKDDVLDGLNDTLVQRLTASRNVTGAHQYFSAVAAFYSLHAVSYEGGPDTSCFFSAASSVPAKVAAHLDPRMRTIVSDYAKRLQAFTGSYDLTYFTWGVGPWNQFGEWTLAPNMSTWPGAPKLLGLQDAMAAPLPAAASLGVQLPAAAIAASERAAQAWSTNSDSPWARPRVNATAWFVVRPAAGRSGYTLSVNATVSGADPPGAIDVSVNNGAPTRVSIAATGVTPATVSLQVPDAKALSVVELRAVGDSNAYTNFTVFGISIV